MQYIFIYIFTNTITHTNTFSDGSYLRWQHPPQETETKKIPNITHMKNPPFKSLDRVVQGCPK